MKKHILFIAAAILVLQSINLNAQKNQITVQNFKNFSSNSDILLKPLKMLQDENQKLKETIAKPGYIEEYSWSGMWDHEEDSYLKYDDNGNKIEEVVLSYQTQDTLHISTWMYDEYGNQIEYLHHIIDNGNLVVHSGYRNIYEHDEFGNMTESITQMWNEGTWVNLFKSELSLGSQGEWLTRVDYSWGNEEWIKSSRLIDIAWHNWDKWQVETMTVQYWEDEWVNSERNSFTYTGDNYIGVIELYEDNSWNLSERKTYNISDTEKISTYEFFENEEWIYDRRYTYYYNEFGGLIERIKEEWENSAWELTSNSMYLLSYNENNELIEEIHQEWSNAYQVWQNIERFLYNDYQYFELGTKEIDTKADLLLYPNPANDYITIDLPGITTGYNVHIYNILGQEVYTDISDQGNIEVDIRELPDGLYIVQIELDGNKIISKKFMKQ
ncbi:MAG: T9SS type A sorting domain-containing protein [Bacteroidales bacterium]|nr:T9SS type A sorting domain-containing protein [Bacteroidales bacterium]